MSKVDSVEVIIEKYRRGESLTDREQILLLGFMSRVAEERSKRDRERVKKVTDERLRRHRYRKPQEIQGL